MESSLDAIGKIFHQKCPKGNQRCNSPKKQPGRKPGHPGTHRPVPEHIDQEIIPARPRVVRLGFHQKRTYPFLPTNPLCSLCPLWLKRINHKVHKGHKEKKCNHWHFTVYSKWRLFFILLRRKVRSMRRRCRSVVFISSVGWIVCLVRPWSE